MTSEPTARRPAHARLDASPAGDRFRHHLRTAAEAVVRRFPEALRPEIYALSLRVWRVDGDERHPYVAIGYNTETQCAKETSPQDPDEARWNYALWLLDGFETLGNVPEDPVGGPLFVEAAKEQGIWFEGDYDFLTMDLPEDEEDELDFASEMLRLQFHADCVDLARRLHADGTLTEIFGRALPVVVFDMDSPGWEVKATRAANPPGVIEDFMVWQTAAVFENAPRTEEFLIDLDAEWLAYFREMADVLVTRFGVSRAEAVARVNERHVGEDLAPMGEDLLGHELPEFWAHHLYFEPDSLGMLPSGAPETDGDLSRWTVRPAPPDNSGAWTLKEES
ncbi:hypothetical protein [Streptomyces sp. NPDC059271]|uniref:hypothetical protein n=1 Tax=Streptomyces sp. NPDC059271 TaxID=3346799 RepID=UPI0036B781EF